MKNYLVIPIVLIGAIASCSNSGKRKPVTSNLTPSINSMFVDSLETLIDSTIKYDPRYRKLKNMCDDVPADIGVCSDVVVRAFAKIDRCLAQETYDYRKQKGLATDRHIDHRRVRNLGALFTDYGYEIPAKHSRYNSDYYKPGDILWWKINGTIDHVGIVSKSGKVLHNYGMGQVADVTPFAYKIHKVYRLKDYAYNEYAATF